jgi:hypothetical protein
MKSVHCLAALALLALPLTASSAFAQAQRLNGTIVAVDGPTVTLQTPKGETAKVTLTDKGIILAVEKVKLDDIKVGEFIGVGAVPQPDGSQKAVRVNIFDEARRGTGEGFREGWGTDGKGTMTNATVDTTVANVDGPVLMVKYKGGEKKIIVPPDAIIQRNVPGTTADLKPGAAVSISAATPKGEGAYETARIAVGRDGFKPD